MVMIAEATEHDEQVALAEELIEKADYRGAAQEAEKVLNNLEPHLPTIAQAAIVKGRALMAQTMHEMSKTGEPPTKDAIDDIIQAFELALLLDPDSQESDFELTRVSRLLRQIPPPPPPKSVAKADLDVLVVGAGAAGVGIALMLAETFCLGKSRVAIIERGEKVGESFRRWPKEMKFISPSFNQQGWTNSFDLNAVSKGTSPAYSLHTEHPSGEEYATYLEAIVQLHKLNVRCTTEVVSIRDVGLTKDLPLFSVDIQSVDSNQPRTKETLTARYIVWAAGEFQYPKGAGATYATQEGKEEEEKKSDGIVDESNTKQRKEFPGTEICMHNSQVRSWASLPGEDFIVIGGYESGVDAAINLSRAGKKCAVLASTPCWSVKTADPSAELAPYTAARLRDVLTPGFAPQPRLYAPLRVVKVERDGSERGGFLVTAEWQKGEDAETTPNLRNIVNRDVAEEQHGEEGSTLVLHTPNPPMLCTGFEGSVAAAASHLFDFAENGVAADGDKDEDDLLEEPLIEEMELGGSDDEIEQDDEMEMEMGNDEHTPKKAKGCLEGAPLLTDDDESTKVPGVFLVGPTVSHGTLSFCFVYKFRQRFAIVAKAICEGLGMDTRAAVSECRNANMFMEDFSCCEDECGDVC